MVTRRTVKLIVIVYSRPVSLTKWNDIIFGGFNATLDPADQFYR